MPPPEPRHPPMTLNIKKILEKLPEKKKPEVKNEDEEICEVPAPCYNLKEGDLKRVFLGRLEETHFFVQVSLANPALLVHFFLIFILILGDHGPGEHQQQESFDYL